ncbi:uncharacterized protein METZ01_LOCUS341979 [marine metagenome]|uniref:Uncharacterized protein n=1 Tax=marine metagenome TaxID=408172 RepID=A0A382QW85_9ZZZZ
MILAIAFAIAWITKPNLRQRIERPKHLFAEQLKRYDQQYRESTQKSDGPLK